MFGLANDGTSFGSMPEAKRRRGFVRCALDLLAHLLHAEPRKC